jgi:L-alanine-DL-glutamate epimerase-like enolase superfamily enzyme
MRISEMELGKKDQWSRRSVIRSGAFAAAAGVAGLGFMGTFNAAAAQSSTRTTISDVQTMTIGSGNRTNHFIKITSADGHYGISEAYGSPGAGVVDGIMAIKPTLIGKNPLEIDRIYTFMGDGTPSMSGSRVDGSAHNLMRAASAIEMALWDLAGKILDTPLSILMGGRFRSHVRLYDHSRPENMFDKGSCSEWAARVREDPSGFTAHKINIPRTSTLWGDLRRIPDLDGTQIPDAAKDQGNRSLTTTEVRRIAQGFENMREAIGWDHDLMAHCHWELDLSSAIRLAEALEPVQPFFFEDPLPVDYTDSWKQLTARSPVPIMTGENLARREGFYPFIANQATHYVNPDLRNSGGFMETKRIADLGALHGISMNAHNTGTQLHTYQVCQWAAAVRDFVMCETTTGRGGSRDQIIVLDEPYIVNGYIKVSEKPGAGAELNREVVEPMLAPGQQWWG